MSKSKLNPPKSGTKLAALLEALVKGETITQLTVDLGWKCHTVRAAVTRLRQRGYRVERIAGDVDQPSTYRLKSRRG